MDIQYEYRRNYLYGACIASPLNQKNPPSNFHLAVACAVHPDVYSCWNFKQIWYYGFTFQVYN